VPSARIIPSRMHRPYQIDARPAKRRFISAIKQYFDRLFQLTHVAAAPRVHGRSVGRISLE